MQCHDFIKLACNFLLSQQKLLTQIKFGLNCDVFGGNNFKQKVFILSFKFASGYL